MAFWGHSFVFHDIPCEDYDLMIYNIENHTQSDGRFASGVTVIEDFVSKKWKPYFYGTQMKDRLEFTMVFGVNQQRIDEHQYLDRYELEAIACWLTGYDKYMWLEIEQQDLEYVRYKCIITSLKQIEYDTLPWALEATVTCDGPYAYLYPQSFEYSVNGTKNVTLFNESSHNGFFMPKIEISSDTSIGSFSIENLCDPVAGRVLQFSKLPASVKRILVDNDNGVITNDAQLNLYPYFNFKYLRLVKGNNILKITGNATLVITCEFPVNVGG